MDDQQQILAMILSAKAAGKDEDEIVEMLREARDAQPGQDNPILESAPAPTINEQYEPIDELDEEQYELLDEQDEEIEWIFSDEDVEDQPDSLIDTQPVSILNDDEVKDQPAPLIDTQPVSILNSPTEWEISVDDPLTIEPRLEPVRESPSNLAIVKTSQLGEPGLNSQINRKQYHQSPLAILGAFVFLGAVVGVTVYQFFRLHPQPPNTAQEETFETPIEIVADSPTINPGETPLPPTGSPSPAPGPPTVAPSNYTLPPGCGAFAGTREAHIKELQASSATLGDSFPAVCQTQLDELQFKYAIEKLAANDGDFQAAATMICEVTDTHFKTDQDPFRRPYFRDWSENNSNFKAWLEKHLVANDCPAANYLQ